MCDVKGRSGLSFQNELNGKSGAMLKGGLRGYAFVISPQLYEALRLSSRQYVNVGYLLCPRQHSSTFYIRWSRGPFREVF